MTAPQASSSASVRFGQPSGGPDSTPGFGPGGALIGATLVLVLLGGLLWSATAGHAVAAQHPRLFAGSLVLEDQRQLTVIDVATGEVTVALQAVNTQVGAPNDGDVQAVPVDAGTMLIDRRLGTFNLLGKDNYVVDAAGPGVGLGNLTGVTGASGLSAGANAYIVRYAPRSTVSLVDEATVAAAAKLQRAGAAGPTRAVTPRGFAALGGAVADQPGSAAVSGRDLWALVGAGTSCQVQQLQPVASGHNGLFPSAHFTLPTVCGKAAVEAIPGAVGVATPGHVRLFRSSQPGSGTDLAVPGTASDSGFLPVNGTSDTLWYLARGGGGWSVFGVSPTGRVIPPAPLTDLGPGADPVTPVESRGVLYTLDQAAAGQPTLWTVLPATGAMIPLRGQAAYPSRSAAEKAAFRGAQVLVDGPRVVFNNPGSLLAVVAFTDGTHAPVVVDKSSVLAVSAVGPADLNVSPAKGQSSPGHSTASRQVPLVQAVNQNVTCANTTQKPYAPQITSVTPSSGTALVAWSYQLLDQQDCEPASWAVRVTALNSSHQPAQPVQIVNGQTQLQFTGLRPATTYKVTVTAYINTQSTSSTPATFTTAARGPDAPSAVHTTADGKGDWLVSWAPCSAANCFVPADTWNIIGAACGSSFVGQPPTIQVPAGRTTLTINSDSLGLLGDSLSFTVQGVLASGLTGNPTPDHTCAQAWRPPNPADIHLAGSGALSPDGRTITATLQVSTSGPSPAQALGSHSTQFIFAVGPRTVGPTTAPQVTVPGLTPGVGYTPTVRVYPTGHPAAVAVVSGPPFTRTLQWPAMSVKALGTVNGSNPNAGTVLLTFHGLPAGLMAAAGNPITCGSTQTPNPIGGLIANGTLPITMPDLVNFGGACSLSVTLSDTAKPSRYGVSSPALQASFSIGTQPGYGFTDQIDPDCQQTVCLPERVEVDYAGLQPASLKAGANWTITSSTAGGGHDGLDPCGTSSSPPQPPTFPIVLTLPVTCVDPSNVDVQVTYKYLGQTLTVDAGTPSGTPGTTTSTSTTSTTSATIATSTTRPAAPAAVPGTQLAAAEPQASHPVAALKPTVRGDAQVRAGLQWTLMAAVVAWCGGATLRALRRKQQRRS